MPWRHPIVHQGILLRGERRVEVIEEDQNQTELETADESCKKPAKEFKGSRLMSRQIGIKPGSPDRL